MAKLLQTILMLWLLMVLFAGRGSVCFFVGIVNVTACDESDYELGQLELDSLMKKHPFDQKLSGKLMLPMDLDIDAVLEYKASIWDNDDEEWKLLYTGERSVCRSLIKSLAYQKFAFEQGFPQDCPIPEGNYELNNYPMSGQYVVFNTVRGVNPIVRHRIRLLEDRLLILCRVVYTISNGY